MSDPSDQQVLAEFVGPVTCARVSAAALTLSGAALGAPAERLVLTFIGVTSDEVPATLAAARVTAVGGQVYRLESPPEHWMIRARALHMHRDVQTAFFQAIPPRHVPLVKRLIWRVVLRLAAHRSGLRLLAALRGR
ncbi:MAG: hypothetical protein ACP5P4_08425 [Steroidobacteraceae bacterium]